MKQANPKKLKMMGMLLMTLVLLAGCAAPAAQPAAPDAAARVISATEAPTASAAPDASATASDTAASPTATAALKTFTADELAKYDGQNGNPAYIAVNGMVYDVTAVPQWQNGSHFGRFQAGRDLSEEIKLSPHGVSKLETVPVVGLYQP